MAGGLCSMISTACLLLSGTMLSHLSNTVSIAEHD